MPTESSPTAPQQPLELLLRAVDRVVNASLGSVRHAPSMHEAIMHLNNAAQYMRTVQKPAEDTVQVSKQLMQELSDILAETMNNARLDYVPSGHEAETAAELRLRIDNEVNGS